MISILNNAQVPRLSEFDSSARFLRKWVINHEILINNVTGIQEMKKKKKHQDVLELLE